MVFKGDAKQYGEEKKIAANFKLKGIAGAAHSLTRIHPEGIIGGCQESSDKKGKVLNMETKKVILTHAGMEKMEQELLELKTVKRHEVAQKIKEARAQGDLSENAEYDAAKDEQGKIEGRIAELEKTLRNAQVIDEEDTDLNKVSLGCRVVLYDQEFDENITYTIVGSTEADPMEGLISNESPVGAAVLGAAVGDEVEVTTPGGITIFKVLEISR